MPNTQTVKQSSNHRNTLREQDLEQFTGTEQWYYHPLFRKYHYTDGVRHVAVEGNAYWLLDKIFACQSCVAKLADQEFIVWEL